MVAVGGGDESAGAADGVALGKFLSETGMTTFDGGFVNTSSTKSAVDR